MTFVCFQPLDGEVGTIDPSTATGRCPTMKLHDLDLASCRPSNLSRSRWTNSPKMPSLSPCAISKDDGTPRDTSRPQTQDGMRRDQQSPVMAPPAPSPHASHASQPSPTPPPQLTTDPPTDEGLATPSPQKTDRSAGCGQALRSVCQSGVQKGSSERRAANERAFKEAAKAALHAVLTEHYERQRCESQWHQEEKFNEVATRMTGWLYWKGLTEQDFSPPGTEQ